MNVQPHAVIWLLCHYPDTKEANERIKAAAALHRDTGLSIWVFGTSTARYPSSVECLLKKKLLAAGVPAGAVQCSSEMEISHASLDTVQETSNIVTAARREGITTLIGVSNRLQLWQVRGLLRGQPIRFVAVPVPLRDWRWWYVIGRIFLIPLAVIGVGQRFLPLVIVRRARATLTAWSF